MLHMIKQLSWFVYAFLRVTSVEPYNISWDGFRQNGRQCVQLIIKDYPYRAVTIVWIIIRAQTILSKRCQAVFISCQHIFLCKLTILNKTNTPYLLWRFDQLQWFCASFPKALILNFSIIYEQVYKITDYVLVFFTLCYVYRVSCICNHWEW